MSDMLPTDLEPVESVKKLPMLAIDRVGQILPRDSEQVNVLAQYMAKAGAMLPAHLRGNPAMCMGVIYDAVQWKMNPFRLATQHMVVNGVGSYMSQAITAIINQNAVIQGKLVPIYEGTGDNLVCKLAPISRDGQLLPYESPKMGVITPKNSPLWKADPQQQIFYFSARAWCRRYFPELLMGVYDPEESRSIKDITPAESQKVDNFLEDEVPPKDVHEGEVLPPISQRKTDPLESAVIVPNDDMSPDTTPITPELIATNLEKAIAGHADKARLEEWQGENHKAINSLPPELARRVRKTLADKHFELEEF